MTMRAHQQPHLADLQLLLLRLAESIDRAMMSAQHVLATQDKHEATYILSANLMTHRLRAELETEAHRLLAQQPAPLGEDLRSVTAALVLADELCRIGDWAGEIETILTRRVKQVPLKVPTECSQMVHSGREILQGAMRAVITRDASAVERLRTIDEKVNFLYQQTRQMLLAIISSQPELSEPATELLWAAYHLRSMADCGVRIAERAAFIATGAWPISVVRDSTNAVARSFAGSAP